MTPARKAELVLKVEAAMTDIAPMLRDGVGPETQVYQWTYDIILDAIQHVEREVWERAAKHFASLSDAEYNKTPDEKIADGSGTCFEMASDWCRNQAKETT